jgi:allantoate deiminase
MQDAGLRVWTDAIGNVRGLLGSEISPRLVIGSHLDTVTNAGAFDGPLGVIIGIELAAAIAAERVSSFALEVIGFSEEEGVRFGKPFLGSLALVGELKQELLELTDADGLSIEQAVRRFGVDAPELDGAKLDRNVFGYIEFHIEQGPVLEAEGLPLGIVDTIVGQTRMQVRFLGHANHAGTTPMGTLRRDALAAAAEWIGEVERYANAAPGLVATVGKIEVPGGAGNVIAGECLATLDVRHAEDEVRAEAVSRMQEAAARAARARGVVVETRTTLDQPAVPMDSTLIEVIETACSRTRRRVRRMSSGAGHDAMIVTRRVPAAMIFVRSPGGVSHHPDESVLVEDVEGAYAVGLEFLRTVREDCAMLKNLVGNALRYAGEVRHA